MSASDEPITEPPPAGEDDAYSAATKVGVMPDELMAKLRAEGLLPPEAERLQAPRPSPRRPSAGQSAPSPPSSPSSPGASTDSERVAPGPLPVIAFDDDDDEPAEEADASVDLPSAPPSAPPPASGAASIETPIAFAATEPGGAPSPAPSPVAATEEVGEDELPARAVSALSRQAGIVLAVVVLLALAMAAMSYGR